MVKLVGRRQLRCVNSMILNLGSTLIRFAKTLTKFALTLDSSELVTLAKDVAKVTTTLSVTSSRCLSAGSRKKRAGRPVGTTVCANVTCVVAMITLITPFVLVRGMLVTLKMVLTVTLMVVTLFGCCCSMTHKRDFHGEFARVTMLDFDMTNVDFLVNCTLGAFAKVSTWAWGEGEEVVGGTPSPLISLVPLIMLIVVLFTAVHAFNDSTLDKNDRISLLAAATIYVLVNVKFCGVN